MLVFFFHAVGCGAGFLWQVWDVRTPTTVSCLTLSGHACPVWCVKVSEADEYTVVSGGDDGHCKVWDLRSAYGGSRLTLSGR
jgi:WD40 repeat protein